jgi:hypothetical protein
MRFRRGRRTRVRYGRGRRVFSGRRGSRRRGSVGRPQKIGYRM